MENLLKIHDLPKKRAELLGEACLKLVKKYSQENQLLTDEFETAQNPVEKFNEVKYVIHRTHSHNSGEKIQPTTFCRSELTKKSGKNLMKEWSEPKINGIF